MRYTPSSFDDLLSSADGWPASLAVTQYWSRHFRNKAPLSPEALAECGKLLAYAWWQVFAFRRAGSDGATHEAMQIIESLEGVEGINERGSWLNVGRRADIQRQLQTALGRDELACSLMYSMRSYTGNLGKLQTDPGADFVWGASTLWVLQELLVRVSPEEEEAASWAPPRHTMTGTIERLPRVNPFLVVRGMYDAYMSKVCAFWPRVGDLGTD